MGALFLAWKNVAEHFRFLSFYYISGDTYTLDGYLECMTYAYMRNLPARHAVLVPIVYVKRLGRIYPCS